MGAASGIIHPIRVEYFAIGDNLVPVQFRLRKNAGLATYKIILERNGCLTIHIPKDGSRKTGEIFLLQNSFWVKNELTKVAPALKADMDWPEGTRILFFGQWERVIRSKSHSQVMIGARQFPNPTPGTGLKNTIRGILRQQACSVLPLVTAELAQKAEIHFNKVSVRCQKTRWGSCSSRGNINLNWRLIQCPEWVRDYVIIHELHHRMHLNHSFRFWRSLHRQYKNVRQAELWLRQHSFLLDV